MKNIKVVYLVAGMSSRFNGKVKQFAKVGPNDETLIEMSMKHAANAGIRSIIFVVGEKTLEPFKEKFGNNYNGMKIEYAFQGYDPEKRDRPWGTCDAVVCAKNLIDGPFIVCNGDDLYGEKSFLTLVNHLCESDEDAVVAWRLKDVLPEDGTVSRGVLESEEDYLKHIEEWKKISKDNLPESVNEDSLCNMNFFGLNLRTLELLKKRLTNFKKENLDRESECYLPVEISKLAKEEKIKVKVYCAEEKWMGVTNPEDEGRVKELISLEYNKRILKNYSSVGG